MTNKSSAKFNSKALLNTALTKYGIGIFLLVMMIVITIIEPAFFSKRNLINVATQISINGLLTYGLCIAITTGGIDLSVGSQLALTSCVAAICMKSFGMNVWISCLAGLIVAVVFGLINGYIIAKFRMFPFVVTIATQLIIRGLAQVITNGKAISITDTAYKNIYSGKFLGIPLPIIIFIIITIIMYLLLHWTKFGRYIFAVGGNENAAIASGVNRFWVLIGVYSLIGVLAGLSSIIYTAKTGSAQANIGIGYETDAIAAAVLGGTSFAGGVASIPGCVLGIFIVGFIYNGMNMIGVSSYYQSIVKGVIIIGAVMLDLVLSKKNK
jgi:ribose/xylose/arabinose/galactoside ABC-type transport system permease subunit